MNVQSRWFSPHRVLLLVAALFYIGVSQSTPACAQLEALEGSLPKSEDTTTAPVLVNKREIFRVSATPNIAAKDRAAQANLEIQRLVERAEDVPIDSLRIKDEGGLPVVTLGGSEIITITPSDSKAFTTDTQELAARWGGRLAAEVRDARRSRANAVSGIGILVRKSFEDLLAAAIEWLPRLISAVLLGIVFWLVAKGGHWVAQAGTRRSFLGPNVKELLQSLTVYGVWLLGFLAMLSALGFNSSSIIAAIGVSGFVLGFALKDLLSHFLAGLILLIGRQFRIGDQIVVDEFEGTVERIDLRALHLRTYDNRLVMIPNGDVLTSAVTSNTDQSFRRRDFHVGIVYGANIEDAQQLALKTVRETPGVLADPEPDVLVDELGASAVNLLVRFYTKSTRREFLHVGSECIRRVKEAFDKADILIPNDIRMVTFFGLDQVEEMLAQYLPKQNGAADESEKNTMAERAGNDGVLADRNR